MARLNIFPSNLFFMQPLSHAGHMTDRIRAFAVRSLHVFNTLIAQRWMIDKTPWSCGGLGVLQKGGRGTLVDFKEIHKPPCGSHFFLTSVTNNLSHCLAEDGPPRRDHLPGWGGEERWMSGEGVCRPACLWGNPWWSLFLLYFCFSGLLHVCVCVCVCLSMCILRLCVVRRGTDAINELKTSPARQCLSWRVNAPLSTSLRWCHGTHTHTWWSKMSRQDGWPQTLESCCASLDLRTMASLLPAVLWCCGLICDTERSMRVPTERLNSYQNILEWHSGRSGSDERRWNPPWLVCVFLISLQQAISSPKMGFIPRVAWGFDR